MKKIIILLILIIGITGCAKEQDNFEHYDLKEKDKNVYIHHSDEYGREEYVLADLTPAEYESCLTGLFYKVGEDDYVLLETLEFNQKDSYKKEYVYQFYDDKLYGVGNGDSPMYFEIELKAKNSKLQEKSFYWENQEIGPRSIKSIGDDKIVIYAYASTTDQAMVGNNFECSLDNYKCKILKD